MKYIDGARDGSVEQMVFASPDYLDPHMHNLGPHAFPKTSEYVVHCLFPSLLTCKATIDCTSAAQLTY